MSWRNVKLGNFLKVRQDRFKPKDQAIEGLKRVDKIDFSGQIYLSNKNSNTDMILVKQGDLLISGINVSKGAVAVYEGQEDVTATIHYSSYEFDKEKIDIEFLKLFLKSPEFLDAIKEQVPGGIKTEIKPKHLLPLEVTIPDLDEQREVVKKFSSYHSKQNLISTELSHQLVLVRQLRQAFLREAMQGKLVEQDYTDEPAASLLKRIKAEKEKLVAEKKIKKEKPLPEIKAEEIPFEIPSNWTWCRLGEICTKVTDGFHHTPRKLESGKIYISATHIRESGINWTDCTYIPEKEHNELYRKAYPKKGEILITNRGAGCGTPALIDINDEFSFQNAALIGFNQELLSNKYIYYFILKSRTEVMETFVNGGLQPMLSNVVLRTIPFPLPPLAEQKRIVEKMEKLMAFCDELEANIRESKTQAETLLQVALKEALEPKDNQSFESYAA